MLKQKCSEIPAHDPEVATIIADMWETMDNADGCGLAAPQIGLPFRLFVVDSRSTFEALGPQERKLYFEDGDDGIREVFINARIIERSEPMWEDDEGCLSIPGLSRPIKRHWTISIEYSDEKFQRKVKRFSGSTARMIQHEFDHTEGVLYLDYLASLSRRMIERKLQNIARGLINPKYPMKFV
jgi:peptide deformylase